MKKKQIIIGVVVVLVIAALCASVFFLAKTMEEDESSEHFIELTYKELEKKLDNKESFIFVVTRTNCQFCEMYKPTFRETVEEYKITTYFVNTAKFSKKEYKEFHSRFNVPTTPQTLFITNGEETTVANRIVGNKPKYQIIDRLKSLGYIEEESNNGEEE